MPKIVLPQQHVFEAALHPTDTLILCGLKSGEAALWEYETRSLIHTIPLGGQAARCVKFVPAINRFICGCDDGTLRVLDDDAKAVAVTVPAHSDKFLCLAVHPSLPMVLSSGFDMVMKLFHCADDAWKCDTEFDCWTRATNRHSFVSAIAFRPDNELSFATGSFDGSVQLWRINAQRPDHLLSGHRDVVNCLAFAPSSQRWRDSNSAGESVARCTLVSGSDDRSVRVWDCDQLSCLRLLPHDHSVKTIAFHPQLPHLFTGGGGESIHTFSSVNFELEGETNHGMGWFWSICTKQDHNEVAFVNDRGVLIVRVGEDGPIVSRNVSRASSFAWPQRVVRSLTPSSSRRPGGGINDRIVWIARALAALTVLLLIMLVATHRIPRWLTFILVVLAVIAVAVYIRRRRSLRRGGHASLQRRGSEVHFSEPEMHSSGVSTPAITSTPAPDPAPLVDLRR
jgi:hypothetical protein